MGNRGGIKGEAGYLGDGERVGLYKVWVMDGGTAYWDCYGRHYLDRGIFRNCIVMDGIYWDSDGVRGDSIIYYRVGMRYR